MVMSTNTATLAALLHLASPALPIGAFSYSQGLEAAVEAGVIHDADSACAWIGANLSHVFAIGEAALLAQQWRHWQAGDVDALRDCNRFILASRESAELRAETEQMGWSLAQLAAALAWGCPDQRMLLLSLAPVALPTAFAYAATAHHIALQPCLTAYGFSWIENQVAAALKAVPLGQVAAQKMLVALRAALPDAVTRAATTAGDDISTFSPHLAILSARHETQYSRLFRS